MRTRAGISTSAIHFIISKMVSAVRTDATEVPMPKTKSSSTNGLAATVHQTKKISEKNLFLVIYLKKLQAICLVLHKCRYKQESRAVARKPRHAAAVLFGLNFADNIHYISLRVAKLRKPSFHTYRRETEFNAQCPFFLGHSRSRVLESVEKR